MCVKIIGARDMSMVVLACSIRHQRCSCFILLAPSQYPMTALLSPWISIDMGLYWSIMSPNIFIVHEDPAASAAGADVIVGSRTATRSIKVMSCPSSNHHAIPAPAEVWGDLVAGNRHQIG